MTDYVTCFAYETVGAFGLKPSRFVVDVCAFVAFTRHWCSPDFASSVHTLSTVV